MPITYCNFLLTFRNDITVLSIWKSSIKFSIKISHCKKSFISSGHSQGMVISYFKNTGFTSNCIGEFSHLTDRFPAMFTNPIFSTSRGSFRGSLGQKVVLFSSSQTLRLWVLGQAETKSLKHYIYLKTEHFVNT